jgi:hypothetical protein
VRQFELRLNEGFDIVLVSTYLMYHPHCVAIAEACRARGIPLILGGPYFSAEDVAEKWLDIPGMTALIGSEVELHLCQLLDRIIARQNSSDNYRARLWLGRVSVLLRRYEHSRTYI